MGAFANRVAAPDHLPPRDAASGKNCAEHARPMVSASVCVQLGRATELPHDDNERFVQQSPYVEIADESRERQVE